MPTRRTLLTQAGTLAAASLLPRQLWSRTPTTPQSPLELASAGALRNILEGALKPAAARTLHLDLHTHAQGADAVAHALVTGSLHADLFLPITAAPMRTVFAAGLATTAQPFARTEMVLLFSPRSRFAGQFAAATPDTLWKILQSPGLRFSRSDPTADPSGRNALFITMLAAEKYHQPSLVQQVLGPALNPAQVNLPDAQARLAAGDIDATLSYGIAPAALNLPFVPLPPDINLSATDPHAQHPNLSLTLAGKTWLPEPLIFYVATLAQATNPTAAAAFTAWLLQPEAQQLLQQHAFRPAADAPTLHA